jgi:hypothetical protein
MRGRNSFERAPVRLNVGSEKEAGQDRRPQLSHAPGINGNDVNRAQMANFGPGLREQPRRKGYSTSEDLTFMIITRLT